MNQAHEPQMEKFREMWFEGHQRDPNRVPRKGSKVDTWLGVVQSALGNFDSSSSITKIISLKACSKPISQGQSTFNAKPEYQLLLLKTARTF